MSDLEIINNFIKQLPKLNEVVNKLKEKSEGDIVKKLELNKQIEITNDNYDNYIFNISTEDKTTNIHNTNNK